MAANVSLERNRVAATVEEKSVVEKNGMLRGGKETILLVDDEDLIRQLGEELLSKAGYTVLTAANAEMGLELYCRKRDQVDLIILDMIMPGMGGKRFLEGVRHVNPKVKVIVSSGHSNYDLLGKFVESRWVTSIKKPYRIHEMLDAIRETLDKA